MLLVAFWNLDTELSRFASVFDGLEATRHSLRDAPAVIKPPDEVGADGTVVVVVVVDGGVTTGTVVVVVGGFDGEPPDGEPPEGEPDEGAPDEGDPDDVESVDTVVVVTGTVVVVEVVGVIPVPEERTGKSAMMERVGPTFLPNSVS